MPEVNKQMRSGSLSLILVVGSAAVGLILLAGALFFLAREAREVIALSTELITIEKKKENFELLKRSSEQTAPGRAKMAAYFIDGNNPVALADFIKQLEAVGREAKVVSAINGTSATTINDQPALQLSLAASGTFVNIFRFLHLLENLPYRFEFTEASFALGGSVSAVDDKKATETIWHTNLNLILKSFKE